MIRIVFDGVMMFIKHSCQRDLVCEVNLCVWDSQHEYLGIVCNQSPLWISVLLSANLCEPSRTKVWKGCSTNLAQILARQSRQGHCSTIYGYSSVANAGSCSYVKPNHSRMQPSSLKPSLHSPCCFLNAVRRPLGKSNTNSSVHQSLCRRLASASSCSRDARTHWPPMCALRTLAALSTTQLTPPKPYTCHVHILSMYVLNTSGPDTQQMLRAICASCPAQVIVHRHLEHLRTSEAL